ncbi:hypothetical protein Tco_0932103 [Tanacetum coccineum]
MVSAVIERIEGASISSLAAEIELTNTPLQLPGPRSRKHSLSVLFCTTSTFISKYFKDTVLMTFSHASWKPLPGFTGPKKPCRCFHVQKIPSLAARSSITTLFCKWGAFLVRLIGGSSLLGGLALHNQHHCVRARYRELATSIRVTLTHCHAKQRDPRDIAVELGTELLVAFI